MVCESFLNTDVKNRRGWENAAAQGTPGVEETAAGEATRSMSLEPGDGRRRGIRVQTRPAKEGHRSRSLGPWGATAGFSAGVTRSY